CRRSTHTPKKVPTRLGNSGELLYNVAPKASDAILNTAYKLFPESKAAKGKAEEDGKPAKGEELSTEGVAFAYLMRGVHWERGRPGAGSTGVGVTTTSSPCANRSRGSRGRLPTGSVSRST